MSKQRPNRRIGGFSMLEVIIALAILVIGVSALAALSAVMIGRGRQSKYQALAGTLASEKLEDLNRWTGRYYIAPGTTVAADYSDPEICVPTGTSVGSLVVSPPPAPVTVTCILTDEDTNSSTTNTETVYYYDQVNVDVTNSSDCPNPTDGCFAETYTAVASGATNFYTTYHSPDGTIPGGISGSPVKSSTGPASMTFQRNWVIELNPTVNGVQINNMRRITVLVTLLDKSVSPGVSFQMSMVRP